MSNIVLSATVGANQSVSEVITPGIVSIFIQGLETGLVLSQLSQWLALERTEGTAMTLLVIYVTTIGLSAFTLTIRPLLISLTTRYGTRSLETAACFISAYRIYVLNFGQPVSKISSSENS
jgi:hypothetical protein